jgi:formylglycine-generating enzyme required for sulfatase activity
MGKNPSRFRDRGERCPVDSVSWEDVQKFIEIVSASDRAPYRLPTEAEWEYAARGGERHDVFSGSDKASVVAWHAGNAGGAPQPVGLKPRNGYGLSDMSGNVWEWVSDWYGDYPRHEVIDPTGPETGTRKIYRGGSWYNDARSARVAVRESNVLNYRFDNLGFRLLVPVG